MRAAPLLGLLPLALAGCHRDRHEGAVPKRAERAPGASAPQVGAAAPARPRIYSTALRTPILESPRANASEIGYLREGASSPTSGAPAGSDGCPGGWYPVEPMGFVCAGSTASLDAKDPTVAATAGYGPDRSRGLPFIYGMVRRPGPIYGRLPNPEELHTAEPDLERRMQAWLRAPGEIGAGYAQDVWLGGRGTLVDPALAWHERRTDGVPEFLAPPVAPGSTELAASNSAVSDRMKPHVGFSFLETFLYQGRRYGLTADLALVPTDRLRPIRGSSFHGVQIGRDVDLPFAFVRQPGARLYRYDDAKNRLRAVGKADWRSALGLTGKQRFFRGKLHYETSDLSWISDRDASRVDAARRMPAWGTNGERWLDVNLSKQTLVAYDGTRPVFATLISSGEAGLDDPEHTTATQRGIFRIFAKHVTTSMSSDEVGEEFELRDVPYVQYFERGYALHGAYWHDRFGIPKSHGCINLAPEDARFLFSFTEPQVPPGWHGRTLPLKGSVVFIHA